MYILVFLYFCNGSCLWELGATVKIIGSHQMVLLYIVCLVLFLWISRESPLMKCKASAVVQFLPKSLVKLVSCLNFPDEELCS